VGLTAGSTFGAYRVEGPLGRGGMASVYKAYEAGLDRYVALKTLPPEFLHDETFPERFEREAKAVAKLEHPNIVPIYAYGIEGGTPWMAMRLVPGGALSGLLKRGRLEPARAVAILEGAAEALAYAHSKHVVHRDVKPQNILLDERERVYLADFGIAKMLAGESHLTATGMISGTPQYMAPEQAVTNKVDARADIYALGVVAYELLTGRVPFSADTPVGVLMKHAQEEVPRPSTDEVKEPLMRVLLKALAKKPEDRFETPLAFTAALEAALHELPTERGLPTLELTADMAVSDLRTATAVARPTRPAATAPTRLLAGSGAAAQAPPARTQPASAPSANGRAPVRSASTGLAVALGMGGVAALVLAGAAALWLMRRPASAPIASPASPANGPVLSPSTLVAVAPTPPAASSAPPLATTLPSAPPAALPSPKTTAPAGTAAPEARKTTPANAAPPPSTQAPAAATAAVSAPVPAGPSPEVLSLMQTLGERSPDARWKAAEGLGNLGEEAAAAVPRLVEGLADRADVVRWRSAEALGKIGAAQAAGPLATALRDRDPLVRTEAAKALGALGPKAKAAVEDLGAALSDGDVGVRRAAAKSLASLAPDSRAALSALVQALQDKDKFVRLQSAKALGSLGALARDAAPALTAATKDGEPLVARAAAEALRSISAAAGGPVS
jgi:serine/threonine-protein kinase